MHQYYRNEIDKHQHLDSNAEVQPTPSNRNDIFKH